MYGILLGYRIMAGPAFWGGVSAQGRNRSIRGTETLPLGQPFRASFAHSYNTTEALLKPALSHVAHLFPAPWLVLPPYPARVQQAPALCRSSVRHWHRDYTGAGGTCP